MPIEPDIKDWTWVVETRCDECGFDPATVTREELAERILAASEPWPAVLERPDVRARPDDSTWSPLEYACHVRDVHRLFGERVRLMLDEDDPVFANWDQDVTAVEDDYAGQEPDLVRAELAEAAQAVAETYAHVQGEEWQRPGRRSNGSVFTVESIGVYHLHDVVHHVWDVRG